MHVACVCHKLEVKQLTNSMTMHIALEWQPVQVVLVVAVEVSQLHCPSLPCLWPGSQRLQLQKHCVSHCPCMWVLLERDVDH